MSAIENSRIWLATAKAALAEGIYTTALYGAEMSVEIALKGVLIELGVDIPKSHNIVSLARISLKENRSRLSKEFVEKEHFITSTLETLLDLRPVVGYAYERNIGKEDMKPRAKEYLRKAEEIVSLCGNAIRHAGKRA